ncbi:MAG: hypothetical protein HRU09_16875 [Oligoflexales bacterium]|nr:hypothetical protein [Oligoflexales bacterium]
MSAAKPKKMIDDLSDHVEQKVKKLAVVAARKAVRSLWNDTFAKAIEKEIRHLCTQSIEKSQAKQLIQNDSSRIDSQNQSTEATKQRSVSQVEKINVEEEVVVSNTLNQLDEERAKDDSHLASSPSYLHESDDFDSFETPSVDKVVEEATESKEEKVEKVEPEKQENQVEQATSTKPPAEITVEEPSIASRSTEQESSQLLNQVKQNANASAVSQIDLLFLQILDTFVVKIASLARSSTEYILEVSNTFLDEKAKNALVDFHNLYFGDSKIGETSKQVNAEVDDMLESLQSILNEGKELTLNSIEESEEGKLNRLSLSGLQKRLEMIISMDVGIKEKLIPILHSMQFEDFLNQRLLHIRKIWAHVISLESNQANINLDKLKETLAKYPSSMDEREDFYNIVLKKDPPEGLKERQSLVDILF